MNSFDPSDCEPFGIGMLPNRPHPGIGGNSPGDAGNATRFYEQIGPFTNPVAAQTCVTVDLTATPACFDAADPLAIVGAFTLFNPAAQNTSYLGDIGNLNEFKTFQFNVQASQQFYLVLQQNQFDEGEGCTVTAYVDYGSCL